MKVSWRRATEPRYFLFGLCKAIKMPAPLGCALGTPLQEVQELERKAPGWVELHLAKDYKQPHLKWKSAKDSLPAQNSVRVLTGLLAWSRIFFDCHPKKWYKLVNVEFPQM